MKLLLIALLTISNTYAMFSPGKYSIKKSMISYNVKYLLKDITATSKESKGVMNCSSSTCEVLVGTPVKTFVSKDSNRDVNTLTYIKADKHPLVTVRTKVKKGIKGKFKANLEVNFAGSSKTYKNVELMEKNKNISGSFDILFSDFKIQRPSLLGISVQDKMTISLDINWK